VSEDGVPIRSRPKQNDRAARALLYLVDALADIELDDDPEAREPAA
jgi:hypothetical protein